jgi:hypothetical protein
MSGAEFLDAEELTEVTGYKHVSHQREWLNKNGWTYVVNALDAPSLVTGMRVCGYRGSGQPPPAHSLPDNLIFPS